MISVYHWDAEKKEGAWREAAELPAASARDLPAKDVWWVDLEAPTLDEERLVFQTFLPVHRLTLEDVTKPCREPEQGVHLPKVEEFPDYLFAVVNPLRPELLTGPVKSPGGRRSPSATNRQLSAVLTENVLITHHYEPLPSVTEARGFCTRHGVQTGRGPDYLFHLVLDAMVDDYAPVVDRIGDQLGAIETAVLRRPNHRLMARLLRLKRVIVALRKSLILEREVLYRLTRGDFRLVDDREIVYYRNVYDHLVRYTELIEGSREMVSDLMQTHLSAVSNSLNSVVKVLTMISTVVLPMTLIAGIYGMNFDRSAWPAFESAWGFPFAVGLMALFGVASLAFFWWKGWLGR